MTRVFVGVGSNLGDREKNIALSQQALLETQGVRYLRASPIYETDPLGGPPQGRYLNGVWECETDLSPGILLGSLLKIEKALGRERFQKDAPRTIDLDLLFYGDCVICEPGLSIPHPRLHERWFVLKPMADLEPDWRHPALQKTIKDLLEENLERNPRS